MILLDTHVIAWLYAGERQRLSAAVQQRLTQEQLAVSPVSQLELQYLYEVGRVTQPAAVVIDQLASRLGLVVADVSAAAIGHAALGLAWTRGAPRAPFDRLLAAHAIVVDIPLITKDQTIRQHLNLAWWAD